MTLEYYYAKIKITIENESAESKPNNFIIIVFVT